MSDEHVHAEYEKNALLTILSETENLTNVGGWEWDAAKDNWSFSDNWLRIHGCSKRHLVTSELLQIAHPDDRHYVHKAFNSAIAEGNNYEIEHRIVRQDTGEVRSIRAHGKSILNSEGKVVKIYGAAQDITEFRQTEKKLRESEDKIENIVNNLPGVAYQFLLDKEGTFHFKYMGNNCIKLFGIKANAILSDANLVFDLIPQPDADEVQKKIKESAETLTSYDIEHRVIKKNGETVWVHAISTPWKNGDGDIVWDGIGLDITKRRQAEKALEKKNHLLKRITENMFDMVSMSDIEGNYTFAGKSHERILGYATSDLIGKNVMDFVHPDDLPTIKKEFQSLLEKGGTKTVQYRNRHNLGHYLWFETIGELLLDKNQNPSEIIFSTRDISEHKKVQAVLEEKEQRYKSAQRMGKVGNWEYNLKTAEFWGSDEAKKIFELDPDKDSFTIEDVESCIIERESVHQALVDLIENGKPYNLEYDIITKKNGKRKTFVSIAEIEKDRTKNPVKISGVIHDITERKQANENLRKSEARHSKMFANIGDVIVIIDQDGINRYKSPNIEKLFGWKPEEVVGESTWNNVHPDDVAPTRKFFEKMMYKPDVIGTMECRYRCKDGWYKWIEFTGVNLFHDPDIQGLLGNYHDITERKQAEKLLIKKEALFRGLFDHMTSGSAVYDVRNDGSKGTDYIIREFNRKSLEMEGKKLEEVVGRSLFDLRPNIDDYGLIPAMKKVWETGISAYFPTKIYQDEKFSNYYENHIFKLPSGEVVTIYNDVTDQKNQENALQDSEQMYRTTFDAIPDSITVTRQKDGRYNYVNDGFCNITGYSRAEVIGKTPFEINLYVNPSDRERMAQTLRKNRELLNFEIPFRRKNGTIFDSFFSARPVVIDGEDCLIALAKDVTELKRAEEEKARLETQLNQAQKMESVGRLAGGVAHDFNNMLGVILGHTELALLQADENHDLYPDLKEIQKAAKRSADTTKQLLAFARKDIISPKQIALNDTIESMLNMLRRLIGENIDLAWKPSTHLWSVKMDPSQIDQILANLCVNARDAISGVGKLTIETGIKTFDEGYCKEQPGFVPGDFVMLAVSDNGCGMDKETLDNLFEPFFTTKEVGKGTGLGLSTIYGIVKQNNGFINVYSEPGQGSTFKIYLPRTSTDKNSDKDLPEKKAAAGGTETILLVEDEPSILRMTRMMLERNGYSVISAASPSEAVEKATNYSGSIDLLMTDVVMPEMNGRNLAAKMTEFHPYIKLLFMSGYTAEVIAHQGVLDAGVAFIQKPFSMADMTEKVREVLDMARDKN